MFDELGTAETAIWGVLDEDLPVDDVELIVVDDGSTDGTRELLVNGSWPENVRIVYHDRNRGKGAAIRTALPEARGTWTTIMDADLEYEASDLDRVLDPLLKSDAEAVLGTRAFDAHQTAYNFWYVMGNKGVTFFVNLLYNTWLSDMMTCHKAMRTELFQSLPLREDGFAIEPEIVAQLLLRRTQIMEVPIAYRPRRREEGKKLDAWDGLRVLRTLIRCRIAGVPPRRRGYGWKVEKKQE